MSIIKIVVVDRRKASYVSNVSIAFQLSGIAGELEALGDAELAKIAREAAHRSMKMANGYFSW